MEKMHSFLQAGIVIRKDLLLLYSRSNKSFLVFYMPLLQQIPAHQMWDSDRVLYGHVIQL